MKETAEISLPARRHDARRPAEEWEKIFIHGGAGSNLTPSVNSGTLWAS